MILFHRRLLVLSALCLAVLCLLTLQLGRLTIFEGEQRLTKAQGRLHATTYLPTWRGQIIDRRGKVIAEDVASYAVAVDWDVITGDRAIQYAQRDAKDSVGNEGWQSISPEDRQAMVDVYLPARQAELKDFWRVVAEVGNVHRDTIERDLSLIRDEVEDTANVVWFNQEKAHKKRYGNSVPFVARPIREQRVPHIVIPQISDEVAIAFGLLREQYDDVIHVVHSRQRNYPQRRQTILVDQSTLPKPMRQYSAVEVPLDDVAELIVGNVRTDVWEEDIASKPFRSEGVVDLSGYRAGDEVGKRGLEQSLENTLRGHRGQVVQHRRGAEFSRTPVIGGEDVHVTLDITLQARVEAALSPELGLMKVQEWHRNNKKIPVGTPLRGAVVVLDIQTSEILAMASTPALRDEGLKKALKAALEDKQEEFDYKGKTYNVADFDDVDDYPWLNRAAEGLYPPGSIIKPLVLVAAITDEKIFPGDSIECVGHFFEHVTDAARCWIFRPIYKNQTHGHLHPVEALARSCNIFFYELGTRLGFTNLVSWLQRFGMSQPVSSQMSSIEASGAQGHIPSEQDIQSLRDRGALAFETVSISIGQGALTWSPLHAASAYATLARGGIWIPPSLVKGLQHKSDDLELDQEGVSLALQGLRDSVTQRYGTGALLRHGAGDDEPIFNVDGVRIWGKTGTAEAPAYKLTKQSSLIYGLDHSWFLVMASEKDELTPKVVVAVLVEHGGSGGRVAGPIANQILHAIQAEGYLGSTR